MKKLIDSIESSVQWSYDIELAAVRDHVIVPDPEEGEEKAAVLCQMVCKIQQSILFLTLGFREEIEKLKKNNG